MSICKKCKQAKEKKKESTCEEEAEKLLEALQNEAQLSWFSKYGNNNNKEHLKSQGVLK